MNCPRCAADLVDGTRFCTACGSPASPISPLSPPGGSGGPSPPLPPRYQVVRFLGRGGMGRVYLCRDTRLDVEVAIKVLPADVSHDEESLAQIEKEARASARFRECPGILSLYGFEQHGETWYLSMEFAGGGSLHDLLKREGALPESECRRLGAEVAEALAYAHERKVIHRDIKPANVLLDGQGRAKVADFGIAKVLADSSSRMSTATVAGTPVYMAPEIILRRAVDHRSDLYSLGCMIYELATARRPFEGSYPEVAMQKTAPGSGPPDPRAVRPDLSEDFAAVVRRLLEPDPARRFQNGKAVAAALRSEEPPAGDDGPTAAVAPLEGARRGRKGLLVGAAVVLVALAAGAAVLFSAGGRSGEGSPPGRTPEAPPSPAPVPDAPKATPVAKAPPAKPEPPPAPPGPAPGLFVFTDPPGARITVEGREAGVTGSAGLLIEGVSGDMAATIKAYLPDHRPAEEKGVTWDGKSRREVRMRLEGLTGLLALEGAPPGAAVDASQEGDPSARGRAVVAADGTLAPLTLAAGEWNVTVSLKGFDPWTAAVRVEAGRTARAAVALQERDGSLALDSDPTGADVFDGKIPLGRTPLPPTRLSPGRHALRLVHPDRDDLLREVTVRGEEALDLGKLPFPALAVLDLSGLPPGVTASLEGKPISGTVSRRSGEVSLELRAPKCLPQTVRLALRAGEVALVQPGPWTRSPGLLDLSAISPEAEVRVDGVLLPRDPPRAGIPPGSHRVALSRKGFRPVDETVVTLDPEQVLALADPAWEAEAKAAPPPTPPDAGAELRRLTALLADRDAGVRFAAVTDLGRLGNAAAGTALDDRLRSDPDAMVRRACAKSIGTLKAYDGFPGLVAGLGDAEEAVSTECARVVKEMAGDDFGYFRGQPKAARDAVVGRAAKWWRENVARLTGATGADAKATVTPAVAGPPPPAEVLEAQKALALPDGLVHLEDGRIFCPKDGSEMVLVPEGEVSMGSEDGGADERPVHRATVSAFLMDRREVTVGQYRRYCASEKVPMPPGQSLFELCPVVNVSWSGARLYAEWAGKRLPTEAEWERAARGADGRRFPWGNEEPTAARANFAGAGPRTTTPVGSLPAGAGPFGCFDMAGNVWEWCADWYGRTYYASSPPRDPPGPPSGTMRVVRGGAWDLSAEALRSSIRPGRDPAGRFDDVGFRTARSLPAPAAVPKEPPAPAGDGKPPAGQVVDVGQVLAVNNKVDIYLISLGTDRGVRVGDEFTIFRDASFVAVVVVDKVFADKSSVAVKQEKGRPLKKGDILQGDRVARIQ